MEKATSGTPDPVPQEWDDSIAFGHHAVDEDHRRWAHLVERLQWLEAQGPDRQSVHAVFNDLIEFAIEHFKIEESFLREAAYPKAFEHALYHERVLGALIEMSSDLMNHGSRPLTDTCRQIRELICQHHANEDRHCADWLARHRRKHP